MDNLTKQQQQERFGDLDGLEIPHKRKRQVSAAADAQPRRSKRLKAKDEVKDETKDEVKNQKVEPGKKGFVWNRLQLLPREIIWRISQFAQYDGYHCTFFFLEGTIRLSGYNDLRGFGALFDHFCVAYAMKRSEIIRGACISRTFRSQINQLRSNEVEFIAQREEAEKRELVKREKETLLKDFRANVVYSATPYTRLQKTHIINAVASRINDGCRFCGFVTRERKIVEDMGLDPLTTTEFKHTTPYSSSGYSKWYNDVDHQLISVPEVHVKCMATRASRLLDWHYSGSDADLSKMKSVPRFVMLRTDHEKQECREIDVPFIEWKPFYLACGPQYMKRIGCFRFTKTWAGGPLHQAVSAEINTLREYLEKDSKHLKYLVWSSHLQLMRIDGMGKEEATKATVDRFLLSRDVHYLDKCDRKVGAITLDQLYNYYEIKYKIAVLDNLLIDYSTIFCNRPQVILITNKLMCMIYGYKCDDSVFTDPSKPDPEPFSADIRQQIIRCIIKAIEYRKHFLIGVFYSGQPDKTMMRDDSNYVETALMKLADAIIHNREMIIESSSLECIDK